MDECEIRNCDRLVNSRGLCSKHYQRWRVRYNREGTSVAVFILEDGRGVMSGPQERCAVEVCSAVARKNGYCRKHFMQRAEHPNREYLHHCATCACWVSTTATQPDPEPPVEQEDAGERLKRFVTKAK